MFFLQNLILKNHKRHSHKDKSCEKLESQYNYQEMKILIIYPLILTAWHEEVRKQECITTPDYYITIVYTGKTGVKLVIIIRKHLFAMGRKLF